MPTIKYSYQNLSLKNIKNERWKDIPELEGYFMVSNLGRVKRVEYVLPFKDGRVYNKEAMIMKPTLIKNPNHFVGDQTHFLRITLNLQGNTYNFSIGRMVYHLYVNPIDFENYDLLVVAKDGNGKNIRPSNLMLVSRSKRQRIIIERNRHENILLRPEVRKMALDSFKAIVSTPVSQYNMEGKLIKTFPGIPEAAKAINKSPSIISEVAKGHKITAGGYLWRYGSKRNIDVKSFLEKRNTRIEKRRIDNAKRNAGKTNVYGKIISQYDMKGNRIAIYNSISEAERKTGINSTSIGKVILSKAKSAGGFFWKQGTGKKKINLINYSYGVGSNTQALQKKVKQYDLEGNFLQLYPSVTEAAKSVGVTTGNVVGALKGLYKTAGGFKWQYA